MATVITMPRLSDTMTEGTGASWLKKGEIIIFFIGKNRVIMFC